MIHKQGQYTLSLSFGANINKGSNFFRGSRGRPRDLAELEVAHN
ncbi:hypothetical protein AN403_3520 [Pseudomonas fluorescens]|uniref:Uncharacterized protein n=1 Tax=Pseudomonas fluorescens TaxID=294 RepID=A0A0P8Z229_PSEFL|nr:hypothetical protein AN403_3520 [Pseudomonas fluorescens]